MADVPGWRSAAIFDIIEPEIAPFDPPTQKTLALAKTLEPQMGWSDTIHACDRRTDGQTDGIGVAYTRYSICCRA